MHRASTKRVERMSHAGKKDRKKKQATKQERSTKQQLHHTTSKPHEFSLSAGDLKDINYYLQEDLDNSSDHSFDCDDYDDYEIGPSIFPSKKKQTEMEYSTNKKKDPKVLKQEAKKRAMKREMQVKKKTPQLKTKEGEISSHHMASRHTSLLSCDYHNNDDDEYHGMKVDVDILNESLGKSSSSFSKLYLSSRPPVVVERTSSTEKMKKLFKGMKRRLSMNN